MREDGQAEPAHAVRATVRGVAAAAQLACVLEVSSEKPGNITPSHDFHDTSYEDMLRSAIAIGPELARAGERGVGETVLAAVRASRGASNTNLGIVLLLAPLAKAALEGVPVAAVLGALDVADARAVYAAIRLAGAGGLDERVEHDVRDEPVIGLREAMADAAARDSIASEYATGFAITYGIALPALDLDVAIRDAIVKLHLRVLAEVPDTLIARKRGREAAERVSSGARDVLAGRVSLEDFDASLREPGNALNPGTTADLVTAALFVALLEGRL